MERFDNNVIDSACQIQPHFFENQLVLHKIDDTSKLISETNLNLSLSEPNTSTETAIRSIEIKNFKSYAGYHFVGPFQRSNAIIGPNGSGKSNLMDAISFVLGVNSRHLRGKLVDLVNTGLVASEKKEAFVSMSLHHSKGISVFTRLIQERGQSVFLIDRKSVAEKEYIDSLSKFNLLVRARNFLVFQGDVEDVAQRNPLDLTLLFERISGSHAYKQEYETLENQMNIAQKAVRLAFNQLNFKKNELKRLESEAADCNRYIDLNNQLKNIQQEKYLFKLYVHVVTEEALIDQNTVLDDQLRSSMENKKIKELQVQMMQRNQANRLLEIEGVKGQLRSMESEIADLRQIIDDKKNSFELSNKSLREHEIKITNMKSKREMQSRYKNELALEIEKTRTSVEELESKGFNSTNPQKVSSDSSERMFKGASTPLVQKLDLLYLELNQKKTDHNNLKLRISDLERRCNDLRLAHADMDQKATDVNNVYAKTIDSLSSKRTELKSLQDSFKNALAERTQVVRQLSEDNERLSQCQTTLKEHAQSEKIRETIDDMKQHIGLGFHGLVSDLCKPNKKELGRAVQAALGRKGGFLVVDTYETADRCIEFLKKRNCSRMEFLPLEGRKRCVGDQRFADLHFNYQPAIRQIHFDNIYQALFEEIFKDTVVVKDIQQGSKLAFSGDRKTSRLKIVTEDGERFNGNSSLTINTDNQKFSTTFATNERRILEKSISDLNKRLKQITELETNGNIQISSLDNEIIKLQRNSEAQKQRWQAFDGASARFQSSLNQLLEEKIVCEKESAKIVDEINALSEKCRSIEDEVLCLRNFYFKENESASYSSFVSGRLKDSHLHRLKDLRVKYLTLSGYLESLNNDYISDELLTNTEVRRDNLKRCCDDLLEIIHEQSLRLDKLQQEENELVSQVICFEDEKEKLDSAYDSAKSALFVTEREIKDISEKLQKYDSSVGQSSKTLKDILTAMMADEIIPPLQSGTIEDINEFIEAENESPKFEISYEPLPTNFKTALTKNNIIRSSQYIGNMNVDFECRINSMKNELSNCSVDLAASKKYDSLSKEYNIQKEDCVTKKKASMEKENEFRKICKLRRDLFMKCYEHVMNAVQRVYPLLTSSNGCNDPSQPFLSNQQINSSGQAFLDLDDINGHGVEQKPFLCGIQYTVMPPSKRFREICFLSGGEKTMAALALLFSLQTFLPAPFFILDEVDAALDSTNVEALKNYLNAAKFQIIVISLKEKLFRNVQSLFGVYKNPQTNSSNLISVDLSKYKSHDAVCPTFFHHALPAHV